MELSTIAMENDQRVDFLTQTGAFQQPSRHEGNAEVKSSSSDGIQGKSSNFLLTTTQSQQTTTQATLHA